MAAEQDDAETLATLGIGESVAPPGSTTVVTVTDVSDDSRCPIDVTCVWAGDATVTLRVQPAKGEPRVVALHVGRPDARAATAGGLRLRLDRLDPARESGKTIARHQYRVVIGVSRQPVQEAR